MTPLASLMTLFMVARSASAGGGSGAANSIDEILMKQLAPQGSQHKGTLLDWCLSPASSSALGVPTIVGIWFHLCDVFSSVEKL
jgi:hypothetical protein